MKVFDQADSEITLKRVIVQLEQAARIAIQHYDLNLDDIRFNQYSDTCTFIIDTDKKKNAFLLRLHSNGSKGEIESEIEWLDALRANTDVIAPKGVSDRSGAKVLCLKLEDGANYYATLMEWVEGEHADGPLSDALALKEGVLLASLHQAAEQFEIQAGFQRPSWGERSFAQAFDRLARHHDRFLSSAEFELYRSAGDKIRGFFHMLSEASSRYGLIHGDLHQGNIVFQSGEPRPIDFGRCGFGYYLYDIAHTILGLYPKQRESVIRGYESIAKLEEDWLPKLETFTVMAMIENYSHHAPDPRETEDLKEEQPYAQAIIRRYLGGEPFLFNRISI